MLFRPKYMGCDVKFFLHTDHENKIFYFKHEALSGKI